MQEKVRYSAATEGYSSQIDFGIFMKRIWAISITIFTEKHAIFIPYPSEIS